MLLYQAFLVVLYAISLVSIVLLLVTTHVYRVRWHPVVSVILWMSIPSAVVALLHYPFNDVLRQKLPIPPADRPLDQQHTGLAYFCAVEAILLYLFSAISSGLTVSFTLSLFAVVVKSMRPTLATSPRTWRSFRWLWDPSTTVLCVVPFIWALPLVVAVIEALVRTSRNHYPSIYYSNTYCNIDDRAYQFASGLVLGLPLIVAAALVLAILGMLARMRIRNRGGAAPSMNVPLALRFAAIVIHIFITAIILISELALQDDQLRGVFRFHLYWTALAPLIFFCIFGTQRDLMRIWRYWAYRLIGREPAFTPRSSNEGRTLSNSSVPTTTGADRHIIGALTGNDQDMCKGNGKVHRPSSSAGGRESISDPLALMAGKHSVGPSELSSHHDIDLESTLTESISKRSRRGPPSAVPDLPYLPETPNTITSTISPNQVQFYSSAGALSSQGLVSSQGHSGTRGLLASQNNLPGPGPPLIVVTDGFDAMFGAQVPSSARAMVGRPILTRQERERQLSAAQAGDRPRRPRPGSARERRPSTGLPPPPRSPRPSIARPASAGGIMALASEREGGQAPPVGPGLSAVSPESPTAPAWNWDSPFRVAGSSSALEARSRDTSDGGFGSPSGSDQGIEMQEKIKTPSNGSFEQGYSRKESQDKENRRDSRVSKKSRVSVASDRTFG